MSGRLSLKPYYIQRDGRIEILNRAFYDYLPKGFSSDLIGLLTVYTITAEDLDIVEEGKTEVVDFMNAHVRTMFARLLKCKIDTYGFYIMSVAKVFEIYKLGPDETFMKYLMNGGFSKGREGFSYSLSSKPFADAVCQQLYKIKTRNKYYLNDKKAHIYTDFTYLKRYRCMVQRDQDTVNRLFRMVDKIEEQQAEFLNDPDVLSNLLPVLLDMHENNPRVRDRYYGDDKDYEKEPERTVLLRYLHKPDMFDLDWNIEPAYGKRPYRRKLVHQGHIHIDSPQQK